MDSSIAETYTPSLGVRKGLYAPRSTASGIIIHTTGAGVNRRYIREHSKYPDNRPLDTAVRIYGHIMKASGHYVVDQNGRCVQMVPEGLASWHVGSKGARKYKRQWMKPKYDWWRGRWPGYESPLEIANGDLWRPYAKDADVHWRAKWLSRHGSCNANTIGIEVIPPIAHPQGQWTDLCWSTVVRLTEDIRNRNSIPLERARILSHSDVHPISRTTNSGRPWDPSLNQFSYETFLTARNIHLT